MADQIFALLYSMNKIISLYFCFSSFPQFLRYSYYYGLLSRNLCMVHFPWCINTSSNVLYNTVNRNKGFHSDWLYLYGNSPKLIRFGMIRLFLPYQLLFPRFTFPIYKLTTLNSMKLKAQLFEIRTKKMVLDSLETTTDKMDFSEVKASTNIICAT